MSRLGDFLPATTAAAAADVEDAAAAAAAAAVVATRLVSEVSQVEIFGLLLLVPVKEKTPLSSTGRELATKPVLLVLCLLLLLLLILSVVDLFPLSFLSDFRIHFRTRLRSPRTPRRTGFG